MSGPQGNPTEDDLTKRLVGIIDKAVEDLCRATTIVYRYDDLVSLNTALDKVCGGVSRVITDLRGRPNV